VVSVIIPWGLLAIVTYTQMAEKPFKMILAHYGKGISNHFV
jgi:hypothetical protein